MELQVHAGKVQNVGRSHGFLERQVSSRVYDVIQYSPIMLRAGRRATQVELQVHAGKVQYVGRSHGFLEWQSNGEAQPRIMFNAFDVEGNLTLCVGDEVTFTVADKVASPPFV